MISICVRFPDGSECWEFKTMPNFDDYNDEYLNEAMTEEWFNNIKEKEPF